MSFVVGPCVRLSRAGPRPRTRTEDPLPAGGLEGKALRKILSLGGRTGNGSPSWSGSWTARTQERQMKFGISIFLTEDTIGPAALAHAMEDLGFEALFIPEHTHIPVSRRSPYPGGGDLPREYSHT